MRQLGCITDICEKGGVKEEGEKYKGEKEFY